jgi:predicted nucleic acid-binding protein
LLEYQNAVVIRNYPPNSWEELPVLELTESEREYTYSLPAPLGPGECECIAVAVHRQGSFVSDDGHARAVARSKGLEISGTIGILLICSEMGIVTFAEANALLKQMIATGYRSPVDDLGKI